MTNQTRIEQRFQAANPVPDPADPPMDARTAAMALLHLEERRGNVQTQEIAKEVAPSPKRPRGALVAAVVATVIAVGAVVLWAPWDPNGPPVAEVGEPTVTFDEASFTCSYTGPTEFALDEDATFTGINDSDVPLIMGVIALRDGVNPDSIGDQTRNPGIVVVGTGDEIRFPEDAAEPTFSRRSLGVREGINADDPGTWIVVCDSPSRSDSPQIHQVVETIEVVGAG